MHNNTIYLSNFLRHVFRLAFQKQSNILYLVLVFNFSVYKPVHAQQAYSLNQWDSEVIPGVSTDLSGITALAHNGTDTWMAITNDQVLTSSDGSTWTEITSNFDTSGITNPNNLTYDNGRWKIGNSAYGIAWSDDDGATWITTANFPAELISTDPNTPTSSIGPYASKGDVWVGSSFRFFSQPADSFTGYAFFITADNGDTWTMKPVGDSDDWSGVPLSNAGYSSFISFAFGQNDRVVAVGTDIAYSDDNGNTWVVVANPATEQFSQVATDGNGNWVAAGTQSVAYSSDNGATWQLATTALSGSATIAALAYGFNFESNPAWTFVTGNAESGGIQIGYSEDGGATWSAGQFATPNTLEQSGQAQAAYGPEGFRFTYGDLLIYPRIIQIPDVIELVDPNFDNQIVSPGQNINLPFRVKDTEGEIILEQSGIVYEVLSGGGSVSTAGPMITSNGTASVNWTVGTAFGVNTMKAGIQGTTVETIVTATVVYPAPTNLFPMPGTDDVEIFFQQEFAENITNYEYQLDDGTWRALSPADGTSPITISGLTQGTEVGIRLRATDGTTSGLESAQIFITPGGPSAPTGLSASGIGEAVIAFTEPEVGGPFTNYQYSIDSGAWQTFSPPVTSSPVTISPLTDGQEYSIRLRAVNSAGAGPASEPVTAIPGTFVPNISLSPETNAFKVTITNWQDFLDSDPGIDDPTISQASQAGVKVNLTANGVTTSYQALFSLSALAAGEFIFPTDGGFMGWDLIPNVVGGQEYQVSLQLAYESFDNPLSPVSNTAAVTPNSPPPAATPVISAVSSNAGGGVSITIQNTEDYVSLSTGRWDAQVSIDGGSTFLPDVINIWSFAFPSTYPTFTFPPQGGDPLINGQAYDVVIKLIDTFNQIGTSGPSNQVTVTPQAPTPPPTPVITSVVPGDQTLTLQIDIPAGSVWDRLQYKTTNGNWETVQVNPSLPFGPKTEAYTGTAIIEYDTSFEPFRVCMDGDGNVLDGVDISVCVLYDEDDNPTGNSVGFNPAAKLVNGTLYGVRLRTLNFTTGPSEVSEEVSGTPEVPTAPETPTITNVIPGDQTLTLEFNIPASSAWDRIEYKTSNGNYISGVIDPVANGLVTEAYTGTITIDTDTSQDVFQCNQNGTIINWVGVDNSTDPATIYTGFGADPTDAGIPTGLDTYFPISESLCVNPFIGGQLEPNPNAVLVNGTAYNVKIRAFNSFNTLFAESNEVSGTPAGIILADAPSNVTVTPGDKELTVDFEAPANVTISDVEYRIAGTDTWVSIGDTEGPFTIGGLTNGVEYGIELRAIDDDSGLPGTASEPVNVTPVGTQPNVPSNVTATSGDEELIVDFEAPTNVTISDVEYRIVGTNTWVSAGTTEVPFTIGNLTNGEEYSIEVRVISADSTAPAGEASQPVTGTPIGTQPDAPSNVTITPGQEELIVDFEAPVNVTVSDVEYRIVGTNTWVSAGTSEGPFTIGDLTNGEEYSIEVRVISADSTAPAGEASQPVTSTPIGATQLAFVDQPQSAMVGESIGTISVEILDQNGNRVTNNTESVTLAFESNPTTATLTGTLTAQAVNGLATFSGLSVNKIATGYTLTANAVGLTEATTNSFAITKKVLSITGTFTTEDKTYDGTAKATINGNGMSLGGLVDGSDGVSLNLKATFSQADTGENLEVTLSGTTLAGDDKNNYTLDLSSAPTGTANITPAELTVIVNSDAKFVTTEDPTGYQGVSITGFVASEGESVVNQSNLQIVRSNSSEGAPGEYEGVLLASGLASDNYEFTYQAGDFTIVPADELLVKLDPISVEYGSNPTLNVNSAGYYSSTGQNIVDLTENIDIQDEKVRLTNDGAGASVGFDVTATGRVETTSSELAVGIYSLGASNVSGNSSNFSNTLILNGSLTVTKRQVSAIVADGKTKPYDGEVTMPGLDLNLDGVISGDVVSVNGNGAYSTKAAENNKAYEVEELLLNGQDAGNYMLAQKTISGSDGEVTKRDLQITVVANPKVYDGTTDLTTSITDDRLLGDEFTVVYSASLPNKNVAENVPVIITDVSLSGADANNYLAVINSPTTSVTPFNITVSADTGQFKRLGEDDPEAFSFSVNPTLFTGDSFTGGLTRESGETQDSYALQLGTLSAGNNYHITFVPATFEIRELGVEAPSNVTVSPGDKELMIDFETPANVTISDIEYRIVGTDTWVSAGTTEGPFTIDGLVNGVEYSIELRIISTDSSAPAGQASQPVSGTPEILSMSKESFKNTLFSLYPNPAQEIINIQTSLTLGTPIEVEIYNILGQQVYTAKHELKSPSLEIDINSFNSGVYIVKLTNDAGYQHSHKFIKK